MSAALGLFLLGPQVNEFKIAVVTDPSVFEPLSPVGIWCQNDVVSTSMRRDHVASTLNTTSFSHQMSAGSLLYVQRKQCYYMCFPFLLPFHHGCIGIDSLKEEVPAVGANSCPKQSYTFPYEDPPFLGFI